MYLTILGNLSLWTVIPNESSFGKIRQVESGRHETKVVRYKLCHSINVNICLEMYIFFVSDLCQVGATAAAINAIKFCQKKNPFNGGVTRFAVEQMISQYFTYVQCLDKKPMFAKQNFFNAKRFYHSCYKHIENNIDKDVLKTLYTAQYAAQSQDMIGLIPDITFFEFMDKVKTEPYGGKEEFDAIREELPSWVKELDMKSGVLGEEGYVYTNDEER